MKLQNPALTMPGVPDGGSSRREFLRACVRYPVLAGMAALGLSIGARVSRPAARPAAGARVSSPAAGPESVNPLCPVAPACQTCTLLNGCARPQAIRTRKNL